MDGQSRAELSAEAMWKNDRASKFLGIELVEVLPGAATCRLDVQDHHVNGHDICHGGFIFTLADTAFAFACNSYNQSTVAQQGTVNFLTPGRLGDVLVATAAETHRGGRSGVYDIRVTRQDGDVIAEFRGISRSIRGQLFDEGNEDG